MSPQYFVFVVIILSFLYHKLQNLQTYWIPPTKENNSETENRKKIENEPTQTLYRKIQTNSKTKQN